MSKAIYFPVFITLLFLFSSAQPHEKEKLIQIKLGKILYARPVTTLTNGKLVIWTKGIDGNGEVDGYLTMSAALFNGDNDQKALPDNPLFPATDKHPEVLLHYSNSDGIAKQAVSVSGVGCFSFNWKQKSYLELKKN